MPTSTRRRALGYGVAEIGASLSYNTVNFFLLFFLVQAGLRPGLAGAVLLIGRVLDALVDPLMGNLSDKIKARYGRRSPIIFWGALPFGATFALLWLIPNLAFGAQGTFWLVVGALIVHACVFTFVQTSYLAMTPELAPEYEARTVLSGYRVVFATAASLLAAAAPPLLAEQVNTWAGLRADSSLGWGVMGMLFGLVMSASYLVMVATVAEPKRPAATPLSNFWAETKATLQARGYPALLLLFSVITLGMGTLSAMLPFFLLSRLELSPTLQTGLLALLFIVAAASVPLWTWLSKRLGKKRAFAAGLALLIVGLPLLAVLSPPGAVSAVLVFCTFLVGAGVGSVLLFPWALLPDVIEQDAQNQETRRDGLFYALFTLCQTAAFALAAALSGGVLELTGYRAGTAVQSAGAIAGVQGLVGGVAAGFFLLALVPLARYPFR